MVVDRHVELNSGNSVDLANGAELALAGNTDIDGGNAGALDTIADVVVVVDDVTRERPVRVDAAENAEDRLPARIPQNPAPSAGKAIRNRVRCKRQCRRCGN